MSRCCGAAAAVLAALEQAYVPGDAAPLDAPRATALSSASMLLVWNAPSATAACKLDLKWRVEMRRGQSSGKAGGWEQVATVAAPRAIMRCARGFGCSER